MKPIERNPAMKKTYFHGTDKIRAREQDVDFYNMIFFDREEYAAWSKTHTTNDLFMELKKIAPLIKQVKKVCRDEVFMRLIPIK